MRGTDGIASHILHHLNLASQRTLVDSSTQRPKVVMQTYTLELHGLTIQLETMFARDTNGTDAGLDGLAVKYLMMSLIYLHLDLIQIRCLRRPQHRILYFELGIYLSVAFNAGVTT